MARCVRFAVHTFYGCQHVFRESLSPLLGKAPDPEFVDEIKETVLKNDMIVGIHDLIIHDYGPGRCFISLHAEVPCDEDILEAHDAIDLTEKQLENRYNCFAEPYISIRWPTNDRVHKMSFGTEGGGGLV